MSQYSALDFIPYNFHVNKANFIMALVLECKSLNTSLQMKMETAYRSHAHRSLEPIQRIYCHRSELSV